MSDGFDLAAYLERIGLSRAPDADADGLETLQRAHRLAIPFENLDIPLGRGISLDADALFDKLVTRRRGGFCFEQNALFLNALFALGFAARPLLARVWLGAIELGPKTHCLSLVTIAGEEWIADPGFGGSDTPPMRLRADSIVGAPDGVQFRLARDPDHGWVLHRRGDATLTDGRGTPEWTAQYSLDLGAVWPADLALGSHYAATSPKARHTQMVIVSRVLPDGFASMIGTAWRQRAGGQSEAAEITSPAAYAERLGRDFGIALDAGDAARLGLFE